MATKLKPVTPKHVTTPRGSTQIVKCHARLDIAVFKMVTGRERLCVRGQLIEEANPVAGLVSLASLPDKQVKEWARVLLRVQI